MSGRLPQDYPANTTQPTTLTPQNTCKTNKRLKGLEPSTFCMASSTGRLAPFRLVAQKPRVCTAFVGFAAERPTTTGRPSADVYPRITPHLRSRRDPKTVPRTPLHQLRRRHQQLLHQPPRPHPARPHRPTKRHPRLATSSSTNNRPRRRLLPTTPHRRMRNHRNLRPPPRSQPQQRQPREPRRKLPAVPPTRPQARARRRAS